MAEYLLPCACGQKLRVTTAQAGRQIACACGKTHSVPTLRGLAQLPPAPPLASGRSTPGWSRAHGALFASGLVAVGIGVVIIALCLFRYAQIRGSHYAVDRTADILKASSEDVNALTPVQLLDTWSKEVIEGGLGEPQPPPWVVAKDAIAVYKRWIMFSGCLVVVGLALSAGTLLIGRPRA
jgi:hypothetical protein